MGNYNLTIFYTARKNKKFEDCQFAVYFDNKEITTIIPNTYQITNKSFQLKNNQSKNI